MTRPGQILIVHADPQLRRGLALLLSEVGLDVGLAESGAEAIGALRAGTPDLVLVGASGATDDAFALTARIRAQSAGLPIVMLIPALQPSLIEAGIRRGLTEVWPLAADLSPVVRRVLTLVGADPGEGILGSDAAIDLADIAVPPGATASREGGALRERLNRALVALRAEHAMMIATEVAVAERESMVEEAREELEIERRALAQLAARLERGRSDLDAERALWQETVEDLHVRENNLRAYEARLRRMQGDARDRSMPSESTPPFIPPRRNAAALAQEWAELERARTTLQAERVMVRDECMALVEVENRIRERESRLREVEQQLARHDQARRALPMPVASDFDSGPREQVTRNRSGRGLLRALVGNGRRPTLGNG